MIIAYRTPNLWQTGIQSIFVKNGKYAYLAQQCLAETLSEDPFPHKGMYEAAAISTWKGDYLLRSTLLNIKNVCGIDVFCKNKRVKFLTFEDTLNHLWNNNSRELYMELIYEQDGSKYTLYAPCRYINFSSLLNKRRYLQPISGYVLYDALSTK